MKYLVHTHLACGFGQYYKNFSLGSDAKSSNKALQILYFPLDGLSLIGIAIVE